MGFFCWDQIKSLAYETPIPSVEDLAAHISVPAIKLSEMPGAMAESFVAVCNKLLKFHNQSAKFVCNFNE